MPNTHEHYNKGGTTTKGIAAGHRFVVSRLLKQLTNQLMMLL